MKKINPRVVSFALFAITILIWLWLPTLPSTALNLAIIIGSALLIFPLVWLGRILLDRKPTAGNVVWTNTFIHFGVLTLLGITIFQAVFTWRDWIGWKLPIPAVIGLVLSILSGAAGFFSIFNLALKGLGAPFAIALSQKVTADWMYAWTRNPMVLSTLALLVSLGLYFRSALFIAWALLLVTPALLYFVKVYEERELEIRFGKPYLEYKARTPFLFPRKPGR